MVASSIREKSFAFAVRIVNLSKHLKSQKKEFEMSKQILRSGTSPGANVREAQNGESAADFVHKLGIAQKETAETIYWLDLLFATNYLEEVEYKSLLKDADELLRMIRSAILTKKQNLVKKVLFIVGIVASTGYLMSNFI